MPAVIPALASFHKTMMDRNKPLSQARRTELTNILSKKKGAFSLPIAIPQGELLEMKRWLSSQVPNNYPENALPLMAEELIKANFNPFNVKSRKFPIDLLTDSGTSTYTAEQDAFVNTGKQFIPSKDMYAYAGSTPRELLDGLVAEVFGSQFSFFPTLQGRGAEFLLMNSLVKNGLLSQGDIIISNKPFDTTKGHVEEALKTKVISCTPLTTPQSYVDASDVFLGNLPMDTARTTFEESKEKSKAVLLTLTDNGGGGQPASMKNIKEAAEFAHGNGLLFWIDACRVFENALFIHLYEKGYENKSPIEIAQEMLSQADVVTLSFKKMYSHSGGAVLLNRNSQFIKEKINGIEQAIHESTTVIYGKGYEGGYCGLTGDKMLEIISGIYVAIDPERIASRVSQIHNIYLHLMQQWMPVVSGGHALYVAADQIMPQIPADKCAAEYLQSIVLAAVGVRGCGLGYRLYADWEQEGGVWKIKHPSEMDSLRLAIPRETYSTDLLASVLGVVAKANKEGVFHELAGGLVANDYNTKGFYHFGAKYAPVNHMEFARAVAAVHEIAVHEFSKA